MITNISITTVFVQDIDESKAFYVDVLGFVEQADVTVFDDYRWCTVGHPSQPELQVHLTTPMAPLSDELASAIRRAQAEGGMFGLGLAVDDCRATIDELRAQGVTILNEPEERPYGVEAVIRDNSGNWMVLVEPNEWSPSDAG